MSFGLELHDVHGHLSYSSTDVTWNQVDFFDVAAGGSVVRDYPLLAGKEVLLVQLFVNAPPSDRRAYAHTLSQSGTTITASGGSEEAYVMVLMR
jgi:hypothetical protein